MKRAVASGCALFVGLIAAQEIVPCGAGSYASYTPWVKARTVDQSRKGDQSRFMQNRPLFMTSRPGEPIPTNDWWTDALVERWTGNLWSYPALVRASDQGVCVAFPSYWIDDGTEMKARSRIVCGAPGFSPSAANVDSWHDWDVELVLPEGRGKSLRATLVHGSPFTWVEYEGLNATLKVEREKEAAIVVERRESALLIQVGDDFYGVWYPAKTRLAERSEGAFELTFPTKGQKGGWLAIGLLPRKDDFAALAPFASAIIRSTRVDWAYDEERAELTTTWSVETEDLNGKVSAPVALQGFQPHHLKRTRPQFDVMDGLVWQTPRGRQRVAKGNRLSIVYTFPGMLPYWAAPQKGDSVRSPYDEALFRRLLDDYAERGNFGGDTYWGGKGLLQMSLAMMAARETGDAATYQKAHDRLRAQFEDWLTWTPGEERFYFSYVPRWGGLVGESTSYDSETFNDHHFHYGYFTYSGALLCLVDEDFRQKFGPMLRLIAGDYANWNRADRRFPFFRTFDPWAGHSFAGGLGDGNGNGQESSSEAMQGWGGLYLLGLALGDREMRDAGIFGWVMEARGTAEYWFDRDRENIDYTKFKRPYNSNLTCHGVGWWTYFSGDPLWMHSIQWLPNTPALDYLSEDRKFAAWDYATMWKTKEISGWEKELGDASLGNVLLSYLQRSDPEEAARIFADLAKANRGVVRNADTGHLTYWAVHSHLTYGDLDFDVRADYPCARAFVKDGRRTLMAYNAGKTRRTVHFFDASGAVVGTLEAQPGRLTIGGAKAGTRRDLPVLKNVTNPARDSNDSVPIISDRPVLKEGVAVRLSLRTAQGNAADVKWSSADGTFNKKGSFTPKGGPFATVTARAGAHTATRRFPVEEALRVTKLTIEPQSAMCLVGEPLKLSVEALDQFGGRMRLKGAKVELSDEENAVFDREGFTAMQAGSYTLTIRLQGMVAKATIVACDLEDMNLARLARVTASGEENGGLLAAFAVDGDRTTRWGSRHRDGEWIQLDFGTPRTVSRATIQWENAHARRCRIEGSPDDVKWTTLVDSHEVKNPGADTLTWRPTSVRYLRLTGLDRNTDYGISIFELDVR